jgi:hypothetical protein
MKGLVLYRILSFIVTIFCSFLTALLFLSLMAMLANPSIGIIVFILLSVVLYAWYARRFFFIAYVQKGSFTNRQKDWLQVNAIVALLFSLYCLVTAVAYLLRPAELTKAVNQLPDEFLEESKVSVAYLVQMMASIFKVLIFACSALLVHIIWTYRLLRQHMQLPTHKEEE